LTGRADVELPDLLAEVNARISEYAAGADVAGVTWEFVCECGAVECQERISLSLDAFDELRQTDEPVLAEGHTLISAEARQQVGRSRRGLCGS